MDVIAGLRVLMDPAISSNYLMQYTLGDSALRYSGEYLDLSIYYEVIPYCSSSTICC